jgi:hypothetical protein
MKTLLCKICGEEVEVPDRQLSVECQACAEKDWAEKELIEEFLEDPSQAAFSEQIGAKLADPHFRKSYLHKRALEKAHRKDKV